MRDYDLQDRLHYLQAAIEETQEGVIVTDAQIDPPGPVVVYVNAAFQRLTGYSPEEIVGRTPRILQGKETDRRELDRLRAALEAGENFLGETTNYRKDGSPFILEWSVSPIHDESGAITHFVAVQRDVTERRRMQRELSRALARERELSELKTRFVALISHELRTPLATIRASVELIERHGGEWDPVRLAKYFSKCYHNVAEMTRRLDEVLLLGQAQAGGLSVDAEVVDLAEFTAKIARDFGAEIGDLRQIRCVNDDTVEAEIDRDLVRQILRSLLQNAHAYSECGRPVEVAVSREGAFAHIVVSDEGRGIPESDMAVITEPFFRAGNAGVGRGAGIGLTLVDAAARAHGGSVRLESAEGMGTRVFVVLPLRQQASEHPVDSPPRASS
jgi:PAS domain S-box-containing protein